jgi:phosphatidylglycerol---prolipoprotein diacylglyceryl transferase
MTALSYIVWDVSPELFSAGFLTIRWYGVLFALGFLVAQYIMVQIYKTEGRPEKEVDALTIYMIAGTVIGARLGHCLFYEPEYYLVRPLEILKVWEGGLASHGAAAGIILTVYLFAKKHKNTFLWQLDRIVIIVPLVGAFIRIGNLMNSEIVGKATDMPWGFIFMRNFEFEQVPRHPSQLYEAISCIFIFLFLWWIYKKNKGIIPDGRLFGIHTVLLFSLRFFYEFLKENQVDFENTLALNMGQILSIPLILVAAYLWYNSYQVKTSK